MIIFSIQCRCRVLIQFEEAFTKLALMPTMPFWCDRKNSIEANSEGFYKFELEKLWYGETSHFHSFTVFHGRKILRGQHNFIKSDKVKSFTVSQPTTSK